MYEVIAILALVVAVASLVVGLNNAATSKSKIEDGIRAIATETGRSLNEWAQNFASIQEQAIVKIIDEKMAPKQAQGRPRTGSTK